MDDILPSIRRACTDKPPKILALAHSVSVKQGNQNHQSATDEYLRDVMLHMSWNACTVHNKWHKFKNTEVVLYS